MDKINVVYIDDRPDIELDKFFDTYCDAEDSGFNYDFILFNPENGYRSLLDDTKIRFANIVFVDSMLFEQRNANRGKFSGEEFKMVLKKLNPFIVVLVITQNERNPNIEMIAKYDSKDKTISPNEYYAKEIPNHIDRAVKSIMQYKILASKISENDSWEKLLKERVIGTLNGVEEYDSLSKKDVDDLVKAFKEIQENFK